MLSINFKHLLAVQKRTLIQFSNLKQTLT